MLETGGVDDSVSLEARQLLRGRNGISDEEQGQGCTGVMGRTNLKTVVFWSEVQKSRAVTSGESELLAIDKVAASRGSGGSSSGGHEVSNVKPALNGLMSST